MRIKIVSIDSNGDEREVGTASRVDFERTTFPDPDAYRYPFVVSPPRVHEERMVLQDFDLEPEAKLHGGIYRELREENARLKEQLETAKENFEYNLEAARKEYQQKLSNQQRNFEEFSAGQERAVKMRKDAEKKLAEAQRLSRRTGGFESVVDEQAAEIKELEKKVIARELERDGFKASRDYWIDRTRDSDARYFALGQKMRDILEEAA